MSVEQPLTCGCNQNYSGHRCTLHGGLTASPLPCVKVEDILARLVELDVPESALTPIRHWLREQATKGSGS